MIQTMVVIYRRGGRSYMGGVEMRKYIGAVWAIVMVLGMVTGTASAQTTNSMASNDDWDEPTAWSQGHIPTGTETAKIQAGVTADAGNSLASNYTGNLILRSGSEIYQWSANWIGDYLPDDTNSTIYMFDGSKILTRHGHNSSTTENPIVIDGHVTIAKGTYYNATDWRINSVISGTGSLTYEFTDSSSPASGREMFLTPPSPCLYSGGTTVTNGLPEGQVLRVYADGAFGTGDVTIKTDSTVAFSGTTDVIDDSASLYIEGTGVLNLGSNNETVDKHFYPGGAPSPAGTLGALDHLSVDYPVSWILGTGILTVSNAGTDIAVPTVTSITDDELGGPVWTDDAPFLFNVAFSEGIDTNTLDAADFENGGTAGALTIGTITQTSVLPGVFSVEVTPASAGTLRLDIASGAVIKDLSNNALVTTSAIEGDDTLDVFAGPAEDTTISGTAGGNNSWNTLENWDKGFPDGSQGAIIASGVSAKTDTGNTPVYTGDLTIGSNAYLQIGWVNPRHVEDFNALGTPGTSTIFMQDGSSILFRAGDHAGNRVIPAIVMQGDVTITLNTSTEPSENFDFAYGIDGPHALTLFGKGNQHANLTAANSFDELILTNSQGSYDVFASAELSLNGNVTVSARDGAVCADLTIDAENAISDTATLALSGSESSALIAMNADDQVLYCLVNGVQQLDGTYGSSGNGSVDYPKDWIAGSYILTVQGPPKGALFIVR